MKNLGQYRKAIAAFLAGLASFLIAVVPLVGDGKISTSDVITIVALLAAWLGGAGAVHQLSNDAPVTLEATPNVPEVVQPDVVVPVAPPTDTPPVVG